MGFQILPNNLNSLGAGSATSQLTGPLASLFNPSTIQNLVYPSDLASNPAMCHAVQFSIYDYTTGFEEAVNSAATGLNNFVSNTVQGVQNEYGIINNIVNNSADTKTAITGVSAFLYGQAQSGTSSLLSSVQGTSLGEVGSFFSQKAIPSAVKAVQAPTFKPKIKNNLANISLYMPDNLTTSHNAQYSEVSFTDAIGPLGALANAFSDIKDKGKMSDFMNYFPTSGAGKSLIANAVGGAFGANPTDLTSIAKNALGVYTNPQIQLIYRGIGLREFTLEFVFTPKSPQEAKTTKDIIDTFTFYSVPGLGSASIQGQPGQYLTPPQLFKIKFVFLGGNGLSSTIGNVFSSALSNLGLGSLITSNPTSTITNGQAAKVMSIQECVLESVNVDYAPNGWSAFNDGYPVQTKLSLQFKETQILTKDKIQNSNVQSNYNNIQSDSALPSQINQAYSNISQDTNFEGGI